MLHADIPLSVTLWLRPCSGDELHGFRAGAEAVIVACRVLTTGFH
jgi:hypothetical protein